MKQKRNMVVAAIVVVLLIVALVAGYFLLRPSTETGKKQVSIEVVHGDGTKKFLKLETEQEFLGPALVEEQVVEDNQGTYGLYILTVDGETADESLQQWWKITKGGERVDTGADQTPIADGDAFELTLTTGW